MYAGIGYELEAMRMLLEVGANPNLRANEGVAGIVNLSSNRDQSGTKGAFVVQAVTLLLDGGADPNARYTDGMTPLMYAALNNNYGLAELLVQRGADLGLKNKDGLTARDIAGGFGHTQVAVLLSKTPGRPYA